MQKHIIWGFLVTVAIINIFIIGWNHEEAVAILSGSQNLDLKLSGNSQLTETEKKPEQVIEDSRREELENQIRDELRKSLKDLVVRELERKVNKEQRAKFEKMYIGEMESSINEQLLNQYHITRTKNYNLLEELQRKYYDENQDSFRDMTLLSLLQSVLEGHGDFLGDLMEIIQNKISSRMSRLEWFRFILRDFIGQNAPDSPPIDEKEQGERIIGCRRNYQETIYDKEYLTRVRYTKERLADMKMRHARLVDQLLQMDLPPGHLFHGSGIVISGGGKYFAGAIVTIAQIRETGSLLPIELMVNNMEEYDEQICNEVKEKFNAKCVVIQDQVGEDVWKELKLTKFQLKMMGLLVSLFDHTILLDADNMPLANPDSLLTTDAYLKLRFVLWPDIWQRTISTTYYDMVGIKPGEVVRRNGLGFGKPFSEYAKKPRDKVHFHDLDGLPDAVSTETGQMVFSKREHIRALILSLYYNVYGPSHYWRLLYQGCPGSGDRDTFVPALHVLNEPYHVVEHRTWLAGFRSEVDRFEETTIVQYDPASALTYAAVWREWLTAKGYDSREYLDQEGGATDAHEQMRKELGNLLLTEPQVLFLHVHRTKFNPILMITPNDGIDPLKQRNLGLPGTYAEKFGSTDWELRFSTILQWVACKGIRSESWWKSMENDQGKVCETMTKFVEFLKKDSKDPAAAEFHNIVLD